MEATPDWLGQAVWNWLKRICGLPTARAPERPARILIPDPSPQDEAVGFVPNHVGTVADAAEPIRVPPPLKPRRAVVIDCETTGIFPDSDRIITFAGIELMDDVPTGNCMYLIFNPEQRSHWAARQVHGYDERTLRYQQPFRVHAKAVADFLGDDLVIGHNVDFDVAFLNEEFSRCGVERRITNSFCTMDDWKFWHPRRKASLDAVCRSLRIKSARPDRHDALQDAFLALAVYTRRADGSGSRSVYSAPQGAERPWNWIEPPPKRTRKPKFPVEPPAPQSGGPTWE